MSISNTKKHLRIGISLGDTGGIGPMVSWKSIQPALVREHITPVLFGPYEVIRSLARTFGELPITRLQSTKELAECKEKGTVYVLDTTPTNFSYTLGSATESGSQAAWLALEHATEALANQHIDALCTAPLSKSGLQALGHSFAGHTEYLAQHFEGQPLMLMLHGALRVALASTHIPLADVSRTLSQALLTQKADILFHSLGQDFGIYGANMAVLGLNPHAGEHGSMGQEEQTVIQPFVQEQIQKGRAVVGPYAADGFFGAGKYNQVDAILAMYHDQGLVGFKSLAFEHGVNYTAGLSIIRTSPVHGTAYELAKSNQASAYSMRSALWAAYDIWKVRAKQFTH